MVEWAERNEQFLNDPFARAAERMRLSVKGGRLPVQGPLAAQAFIMEPDLIEAQTGQQALPPGVAINDAGIPYDIQTGQELPTVRRPNVLPVAKTPDGLTLAMPKALDIVGNVMSPLVAGKIPVKAGEVVLGSGAVRTMNEVAKEAGPFYSSLERAVENAKLSKGDAQQWLGYLKNQPGVKSEELQYVLGELPQGQLTKETVRDIIKNNKVELKEIHLGEMQINTNSKYYTPEVKRAIKDAGDNPGELELTLANDGDAYRALTKKFPELIEDEDWAAKVANDVYGGDTKPKGTTKYHNWQLPGGKNYKEMLLTLPDRTPVYKLEDLKPLPKDHPAYRKNSNVIQVQSPDNIFSIAKSNRPDRQIETFEDAANYIVKTKKPNLAEMANYKSSHWDEPNILAHVRMNDRNIPVEFTPQEKAALEAHEIAQPKLDAIRQAQGAVAKEISAKAKPFEDARRKAIFADLKSGKISNGDAQRKLEDYEVPVELKPLQDKLENLRKQEDELRKSLPEKPVAKTSKTLHLEEIQSDWHQAGRKQGYKQKDLDQLKQKAEAVDEKLIKANAEDVMANPDLKAGLKQAVERKIITQQEADDYIRLADNENSTIPDAPFKKNWDELALKRMLHKAANEGYEGISWTPGEAQAARYDLSKQVNLLSVAKQPNGKYLTYLEGKDGQSLFRNRDGWSEYGQKEMTAKELEDTVGKEVAKKAIEGKPNKEGWVDIRDKDLKIGGEGMKTFYDKMLVDRANNLAKKYGSKVEQKQIGTAVENKLYNKLKENGYDPDTVDIQEILSDNGGRTPRWLTDKEIDLIEQGEHLDFKGIKRQPIHYLPITPELRAKAKEGFPLFSSTPILNPVGFDPFERKKYKLTPVPYDPFQNR